MFTNNTKLLNHTSLFILLFTSFITLIKQDFTNKSIAGLCHNYRFHINLPLKSELSCVFSAHACPPGSNSIELQFL